MTLRVFRFLLVACLIVAGSGARGQTQQTEQAYVLNVDGLACPFCAYGIEKSLSKIDGVKSVKTNIRTGTVVVLMHVRFTLTEAAARRAVKDAGFTLRGFRKSPPRS